MTERSKSKALTAYRGLIIAALSGIGYLQQAETSKHSESMQLQYDIKAKLEMIDYRLGEVVKKNEDISQNDRRKFEDYDKQLSEIRTQLAYRSR